MTVKRVPQRKCTGCGESKSIRELIRIVKAPDVMSSSGEIVKTGKVSIDLKKIIIGRGAYICRNTECLKKAIKSKRIERSLKCKIPDEIYESLENMLNENDEQGGIRR